jgi:spore germination cell wall hydrolase CwlJ-like protein
MWLNRSIYCRYGLSGALGLVIAFIIFSEVDLHPGVAHTTLPVHLTRSHGPTAPQAAIAFSAVPIAVAPQSFEALTPDQAAAANAKVPISSAPNPPARPFAMVNGGAGDRARALTCLTMAVYYEAGNQGPVGEAAVAQVVLNRVRNPIFPKTVCGVVFQGSELPTGCQFTFTCDGSLGRRPSAALWRGALEVAEHALDGYVLNSVGVATHYHTIWVVPYWQSSVVKVGQIGAHVFYRMDGALGSPGAFAAQYAGAEIAPPRVPGDFDTGISEPGQRRGVEAAALPKVMVDAAEPTPLVIAPPPIEIAALTVERPPAASPPNLGPPRPASLFGHPNAAQRLPISSHF